MKKITLIIGIFIAFLLCGIVSAELGGDGREYDPTAVSVKSFSVQMDAPPSDSCTECCKILWDTYHGDSGSDGFALYTGLVSDLQAKGYTVTASNAGVLALDLSQYDVLVISAGSADNSAYTAAEVDAIEAFVNNGGGLLVMDDWEGFNQANVEPVVNRFGTSASGTVGIWDSTTNIDSTHPIFSGVSTIWFAVMGPLSAQAPSNTVAWYNDDGLVNVVEGKKVVIIGDCNIFQTQQDFIDQYDNRKFASNVFTYLCPKKGIPSPEFPSMFLPVTMIIGFLGAVLFIKRP
jgi:hypothetical protein